MDRTRHQELLEIVAGARRRLRMRQLLHGASVVVLAAALLMVLAALGVDQLRFAPWAVMVLRVLVVAAPVGLGVWLIARPLLSPIADSRIALYLEEHAPALEARLLSAVEYARREGEAAGSLALINRLVADAVECCEAIDRGRGVEQPAMVRSGSILAGTVLVGAALLLLGPGAVRRGAAGLVPWGGERNPYRIDVSPRDTVVARGSDLKVTAVLQHFTADRVEIAVRRGAQGEWRRFPLVAEPDGNGQAIVLFDLAEATDYFVEASGVRSEVVHVGVADLPHVRRIDLEYRFPAYTGLPAQRLEDGGDIAAVRGTRVTVEVTPTIQPTSASLVVGGKDTIPLTLTGTGVLAGQLTVDRPSTYRVVFQTAAAGAVVGSPEYAIDVLSDQPPTVRFRASGRDLQVTSVEEVFTEAEARDDFGVARLELMYQVNGGAEQAIALKPSGGASREVVGSHTFFLEDQGLKPGDLVAYYARAVETEHAGGAQQATTDIYFLQVRPFEREYRAADEQPSMGGGGSGASPGELSQRQREIVAGTFNLVRDSARYTPTERKENLATLALAQGRLREDVETLVGRIRGRGVIDMDSTFAIVAMALDTAVKEMATAEDRLGERKSKEALAPEQRALQQLQRAEAAYREIQVARGNQAGGGGGGEQRSAEELADLFDLEMDKLRNQYEQVERGQRQEMDNQLDETLERLRELARRQQQENERLRARMDEMAAGAGASGTSTGQRELAQQTEELARRLERLAREQQRPELNRTARDLREAADAMRRAAAQTGNEGAARGRTALDQLREAQRSLERDRGERLKRDVEDALRRAQQLAEQQQNVQDDVADLTGQSAADQQRIQRLDQRKQDMAQQVEGLERDIDQMSRESAREQRDASRKLGEAANGIRDDKLREKILYSRGVIRGRSPEYARNFEDQIGADIEALQQRLAEARDAVGESKEQRLGRALDRANDLVNGLEALQERLRSQQGQQGEQGQQGAQRGQPGQAGASPQAGQPGQPSVTNQGQGVGGWTGLNRRQFDREWRERLGDADRLRGELRAEGVDVRDLDRIIQQLRGLDQRLLSGDPRSLAVLENEVVQGLKEFEFALRRRLAEEASDRPFSTGADEVPEQYRKMVEEYYKALSGKKP